MSDSNYESGYAEGKRYMAGLVAARLSEIVADSPTRSYLIVAIPKCPYHGVFTAAENLTKDEILERIEQLRQDMREAR